MNGRNGVPHREPTQTHKQNWCGRGHTYGLHVGEVGGCEGLEQRGEHRGLNPRPETTQLPLCHATFHET